MTLSRLAALVTAFTLGNSLTLIIGAFCNLRIPGTPVEVAIALSIFVSALHAWRPLLRGREAWVAAGFGLVHGSSFSQVIAGGGLEGWNKAAAALGFNLGIEFVQILVVAAVVPWLVLLAWSGRYTPFRLAGAACAAIASLAWPLERVTETVNLISAALEGLRAAAPWALALLAVVATVLALRRRAERTGPSRLSDGRLRRLADRDDVAELRGQVAALTDFVTTVTAALVADQALTATIVEALLTDPGEGDPACRPGHSAQIGVASLAHDVLTIVERRPIPSAVRLVYSARDADPAGEQD